MIDLRTELIAPDSAKSDVLNNVGVAQSPFTGGIQVTELAGARWQLTFSYESLSASHGRKLKAIKHKLRGGAEVAHVRDLSYIPRRSVQLGNPTVNGADQSGTILNTTGWTPNAKILETGDQLSYLSTDGFYRMHIVTEDVTADATGNANVQILPPMRNPPVNGTEIDSINPSVSVILSGGGEVSVNNMLHSTSFTFVEALYGVL